MPGLAQGATSQERPAASMGLVTEWTPVKGEQAPPPVVIAPAAAAPSPKSLGGCAWTASTVYPVTLMDQATVTVGGNLYAFAGVSASAIIAASNKFDGTTWTPIAPLPVALEFPTAVTDGTDIYILGGAEPTAGTPQTTLYRYNVGANTYTPLAPFTTGTWNQAAVYLGGKIYKFAGTAAAASTNVLEIYDIAGNSWSLGAVYPLAISFVSAWTDGTYIYGAGGIESVGSVASAKTYRYDTVANTWDDVAIADLPQTRWGAATAVYTQGAFSDAVLAGGYVNGTATANISNTTVSYDHVANTWSAQPNMLGERARMTGAVLNGRFYVVGGRSIASPSFVGTNDNQQFRCTTDPVIVAATFSLVAENCTPGNGAIDPGEFVTMGLCVTNTGITNTTNLVATLQATGGVTLPGPPQTYGVVTAGGPAVCMNHSFVADGLLTCGTGIPATLQLQDGALNLGTATFNLPTGVLTTSFGENFDAVTPPALPVGWVATASPGTITWTTTATTPDSAPNAAFANDPGSAAEASLETPAFVPFGGAERLTFRNKYITEGSWDGGVLEIDINGAGYADILTAGGSFVSGGYNGVLNASANPLGGRNAWTGTSAGGYIDTVVTLPAAATGQNVKLKWRMGSDGSVAATGWWIDTISLARRVCNTGCTPVELQSFSIE